MTSFPTTTRIATSPGEEVKKAALAEPFGAGGGDGGAGVTVTVVAWVVGVPVTAALTPAACSFVLMLVFNDVASIELDVMSPPV